MNLRHHQYITNDLIKLTFKNILQNVFKMKREDEKLKNNVSAANLKLTLPIIKHSGCGRRTMSLVERSLLVETGSTSRMSDRGSILRGCVCLFNFIHFRYSGFNRLVVQLLLQLLHQVLLLTQSVLARLDDAVQLHHVEAQVLVLLALNLNLTSEISNLLIRASGAARWLYPPLQRLLLRGQGHDGLLRLLELDLQCGHLGLHLLAATWDSQFVFKIF